MVARPIVVNTTIVATNVVETIVVKTVVAETIVVRTGVVTIARPIFATIDLPKVVGVGIVEWKMVHRIGATNIYDCDVAL